MIKKFIISQVLKRVKKEDLFAWFIEANVEKTTKRYKSGPDPSVKTKTVQVKIEAPEEGGIFAHFPNKPFPFPGFPDQRIVYRVASAKRLIPMAMDWMHDYIKQYIPENPKLYCKSVRELYRLFNIVIERSNLGEKFTKIRDIVCVFAEYDNAYKFIFQDIAGEANLEEMKLTNADKWWFTKMDWYNFKDREEFIKKYGKRSPEW